MKAGDIVLVRGRSWQSRLIRKFTQSPGEDPTQVTHVGIAVDGTHVVEALWRGVVLRTKRAGQVYRRKGLTQRETTLIVAKARSYVGMRYGMGKVILQAADSMLGGAFFFRRFGFIKSRPICSSLVAECYEAAGFTFGVDTRAATPDDIADYLNERKDRYEQVDD